MTAKQGIAGCRSKVGNKQQGLDVGFRSRRSKRLPSEKRNRRLQAAARSEQKLGNVNHWNGRCEQNERKGTKGRDGRIWGEIEVGDEVSTSGFAPVTAWRWHSLTGVSQAQLSTHAGWLSWLQGLSICWAGLSSLLQKWGSGGGVRLQAKGGKKIHKSLLLCTWKPVKRESLESFFLRHALRNPIWQARCRLGR